MQAAERRQRASKSSCVGKETHPQANKVKKKKELELKKNKKNIFSDPPLLSNQLWMPALKTHTVFFLLESPVPAGNGSWPPAKARSDPFWSSCNI